MRAHSTIRTYVGRLEPLGRAVYVVDADGVERLEPEDDQFGWGPAAPGAAEELARALLTDATGAEPAAAASRRFAHEVLEQLPRDGFSLQRDTVAAWLRRAVTV